MLAELLATFNVSAMQAVMLEAFMEAHSRQKSLEEKQLTLSKVWTGATLSVNMHMMNRIKNPEISHFS